MNFFFQINIGRQNLVGTIPTEVGHLRYLSELFVFEFILKKKMILFSCDFCSFIHFTERINLSRNDFIGTLPTQMGRLNHLEVLFLDSNNLNGTIPSEIGKLEMLKDLRLFFNNLSGSIPSQLFDATELIDLYLDRNKLTGSISTYIGQLDKLEYRKW